MNCGWFNRQRYARRPRPVALNALGGKYGMGQGLVMTLTMGVERFGVGWMVTLRCMAWKAYVGLAGLNVRVFLCCDQLVLLCAGPACA